MEETNSPLHDLLTIMARLRDPHGGCPWDLEQTYQTLAKYTIEEAYEVADAAQRNHVPDLVEELGDLLLQVVFYSQIGKENGQFTFDDVARRVGQKLVSRHPHVFGDKDASSAADVMVIWEAQKDKEKTTIKDSVLDDVPSTLPPLQRAEKLMKRAGKTGFKFDNPEQARDKFYGELKEFEEVLSFDRHSRESGNPDPQSLDPRVKPEDDECGGVNPLKDEYGDVLFSFIAWARMEMKAREDETTSDEALDHANRKFIARFKATEKLAKDTPPQSLNDWTALWEKGKNTQ